jgi:hypothetical protein
MLIELPHGKSRGQWQRMLVDEYGDAPRWSAMIRCPDCEERLSLLDHKIADDGQVTPSVGHWNNAGCAWHTSPKLVGWSPCPPTPEVKPYIAECEKCHKKLRQLGGCGVNAGGYRLLCQPCMQPFLAPTR